MSYVDATVYLLINGTSFGLKLIEEDARAWVADGSAQRAYEVRYFDQRDLHETADERLQRVERCMLAQTAEWMQLTGRGEPPMPRSERERMRDVIDAMQPIVEAAINWADDPPKPGHHPPWHFSLRDAIAMNRHRLERALSNWSDVEVP